MKNRLLCFFMVLSIILFGCSGTTDPKHREPAFYISVKDSITKEPLQDYEIRVYYTSEKSEEEIEMPFVNFPNPFSTTTRINLEIIFEAFYTITIIDENTNEIIDTLINEKMIRGRHSFQWDANRYYPNVLPEGFYIFRVDAEGQTIEGEMFYLKHNYFNNMPGECEPVKIFKTNSRGEAIVNYDLFPFAGKKFKRFRDNGQFLGDRHIKEEIAIELYYKEIFLMRKFVPLDLDDDLDVEFLVNRE